MTDRKAFSSYGALFLAMLLWGGSFPALKIAFRYYHPMFVMFLRLTLTTLIFLPFMGGFTKCYRRGDLKWLALMAFFEPCLYFSFEAEALRFTTAAQAGMICSLLPLLVAVPSYYFLKEKIGISMIIGFLLAIGGSVWLSLAGASTLSGPNPILGNFLEFLAMVCATGYTVAVRKLSLRYSAHHLTAIQAFIGAPFFLTRTLISRDAWPDFFAWEPILAVLYLGVFVSTLAYFFYARGIQRTSATTSALFVNLIPLITLLLSLLLLNETVTAKQLIASALILLGVFVSQIGKFPSRRA